MDSADRVLVRVPHQLRGVVFVEPQPITLDGEGLLVGDPVVNHEIDGAGSKLYIRLLFEVQPGEVWDQVAQNNLGRNRCE